MTVVEDSDDLLTLYFPAGTVHRSLPPPPREGKAARAAAADALSRPRKHDYPSHTWDRNHVLRLMFPKRPYSIWFTWEEHSWESKWYYVNFEAPFVRTPLGVDTQDRVLDIVVRPDHSCYLKDDDQLQSWADAGMVLTPSAEELREEARRVTRVIDDWGPPFCDGWESWRPDPSWTRRALPEGWEEYPTSIPPWVQTA